MAVYISLLRGINVSGHKIIRMEGLRMAFEALGFTGVKTYVQSGNVVFAASAQSMAGLAKKIEGKILDAFGFSVPVFLTTPAKLEQIIHRNPFSQMPGIDSSKLHVTFLSGDPPPTALEQLSPLAVGPELIKILDRQIYLYCPNGYGNTRLSNTAIEKKLSVGATTRNWKTVNTLLEMAR